jgi:hypothetical protein
MAEWLKWWNAWVATVKPQIQTSVSPEKREKNDKEV